jgi:pre-mRNA-splicing helicase BRR2
MGVPHKSLFNFSPKARTWPLEIYFQSFEQSNYSARLMAMAKPLFNAILRYSDGGRVMVFVPSKRQAQLTAIDIMAYGSQIDLSFVGPDSLMDSHTDGLREPALIQVVSAGVGFIHNGMVEGDWKTVVDLYQRGIIRVLVCPADLCWRLQCVAHLVIVMGTESFDGREGRHVDYPIVDVLRMMGRQNVD